MAHPKRRKVVLVGWDAASWDFIHPLLDGGELPALAQCIEQGVMGTMSSLPPLVPSVVYNSVATGKYADKHGVLSAREVAEDHATVRPVTGRSRRAKAFWEILSENGVRCHVVNYPAITPAEAVNGVFVGWEFFRYTPTSAMDGFTPPPGSVAPESEAERLREFVVSHEEIDIDTMGLFVSQVRDMAPTDQQVARLASFVAQSLSVHAVTTWLMENTEWDVLSVNYPAIRHLTRFFLRFHPPRLPWVDEKEFDLYHDVVNSSIRLSTLLLARVLELAGEEATVLLYSPRGCVPHDQLPVESSFTGPASDEQAFRPEGIFVMRGPGVRRDELLHGVRFCDLCPTVLRLARLPLGNDMDGRALDDAFAGPPPPVERVDSWEADGVGAAAAAQARRQLPWQEWPGFSSPLVNRAAWTVQTENDWNLGGICLRTSRAPFALPLLVRIYYTNPLQTGVVPTVAEALYVNGLTDDAVAVMAPYARAFPDAPAGKLMAGMVAQHQGDTARATALFEEAARSNARIPQVFFYLGEVYRRAMRPQQAMSAYSRSVEVDPGFAAGHLGLATVLNQEGKYKAAAEAALKAVAVDFSNAAGHIVLGISLVRLGEAGRARDAFRTALRFDPDSAQAKNCLAAIEGAEGGAETAQRLPEDAVGDVAEPLDQAARKSAVGCRPVVRRVKQEVEAWVNQFIQDVIRADRRLDAYLAENARAQGQPSEGPPEPEPAPGPAASAEEAPDWVVRPALPSDVPTLREFFEVAFAEPGTSEVLVVHPTHREGDVRGAVVLRLMDPEAQLVEIGVGARARSATSATEAEAELLMGLLLRAGVARAAAGGARKLSCSFVESEEGDRLRRQLEAMHFGVRHVNRTYLMDMVKARDRCLALVERYRRHREISEETRVVPISEVPMREVDQFFRRYFSTGIGRNPHGISMSISLIALEREKVIGGYIGYVKDKDTFEVPRIAVAEEYRKTWVTPMLLGDGCRRAIEEGLSRIELYADEMEADGMLKIARHMGSKETEAKYTMVLDLTAPWPHEDGGA